MEPRATKPDGTSYPSIVHWLQSRADAKEEAAYERIYDAVVIEYPSPKGLEPNVDTFADLRTMPYPEAIVAVLPGGYVCGDRRDRQSAILTRDRELISNISRGGERVKADWALGQADLPEPDFIPETVGALTIRPGWSNNYFHWMFQVLPRFHLLRESGIPIDKYLINARSARFQQETLSALGVDEASIVEVDARFHICARKLVVSSVLPTVAPKWACEFLRSAFLEGGSSRGKERFYVSRATAARRKVVNEDEVMEVLAKFKFKELIPDRMSIAEQAEVFASAAVIAGGHGGAFTNLVFCGAGTKVLEFFAPTYVHPVYWMLSGQCQLDYYYLVGRGERSPTWSTWPERSSDLDPVEIDPNELVSLLAMAGL